MRTFLRLIVGIKYHNESAFKGLKQFIVVANHNSHVDAMALMSAVPPHMLRKVHPVAAGDYFGKSKLKSFITRLFVNALLIPRARPVDGKGPDPVQMMLDVLKKGDSLILFPEGSRGEPEKLQKFKKGVGFLLEKNPHIPFIPVFMQGMGKVLPKGNGILIPSNTYVLIGDPVFCKTNNVDEIMADVEKSILSLHTKIS